MTARGNHYTDGMKHWTFAAALLAALSARAVSAEFKSGTYEQAADIAAGRAATAGVYDGAVSLPVLAPKAAAAPSAGPVAAAATPAPISVLPAPAKLETIPLPDMEIAVLHQEPAAAPAASRDARAVNGAIGALAGLAVGAAIGWAVSKALI